MSDTYTKLFSSITESTVWEEPYSTRIAWVTLLAMADASGNVYSSVPGLARRANVTRAEVEAAIASFLAPDRDSRTKDNEGRRMEEIDGGWNLINHGKYSSIRSTEERREYWREWKRKKREAVECPQLSTKSTESTPPTPTPTPTPEKKEKREKQPPQAAAFAIPDWIRPEVWAGFVDMRKKKRAPMTVRACAMVITELIKLRSVGHEPNEVLDQSTRNTWTDVYEIKAKGNGNANSGTGGKPSVVERIQQNIDRNRSRRTSAVIEGELVDP